MLICLFVHFHNEFKCNTIFALSLWRSFESIYVCRMSYAIVWSEFYYYEHLVACCANFNIICIWFMAFAFGANCKTNSYSSFHFLFVSLFHLTEWNETVFPFSQPVVGCCHACCLGFIWVNILQRIFHLVKFIYTHIQYTQRPMYICINRPADKRTK